MEKSHFRKGFGLKTQVQPVVDAEYHSQATPRAVRTPFRLVRSVQVALDP